MGGGVGTLPNGGRPAARPRPAPPSRPAGPGCARERGTTSPAQPCPALSVLSPARRPGSAPPRPAPPPLRSVSAAPRLAQVPPPLPARCRPHRRPQRLTAHYPLRYLPRGAAPTLAARRRRPEPSCASAAAAAHGGLALVRPAPRFVPAHYWPRTQLAGAAGG